MSKGRAKEKQRRRARDGGSTPAERAQQRASQRAGAPPQDAPPSPAASSRAPPEPPAPNRPSGLDVRDGIERPDPVWAPFPLTEIAMAFGIVLFALGYFATADRSPELLRAGALVLVLAVAELCVREHFAGFRSHSILLALLPVTAVHTLVAYAVTASWRGPLALVVDLAIAGVLAWYLHGHFVDAQARVHLAR